MNTTDIDINMLEKSIRSAYDSGKVVIGLKESMKLIMNGKGKLILVANDCPRNVMNDIMYYSEMSQIRVKVYPQSALRLGETCGRPHPISVMVIEKEGNSKILEFFK